MMSDFEELQQALHEQFNVTITRGSIAIHEDPEMEIEFPQDATAKINAVFNRPGPNLKRVVIQSTLFAKHNRAVLPCVNEPIVEILNTNPYRFNFKGIYPLAYCFVGCLLNTPTE